jgi:hypothetical protein
MRRIKIQASIILLLVAGNAFGANRDSVLIDAVKKFIVSESQFKLGKRFYTRWSKTNKPYINLYISSSDKVESPINVTYTGFGTNEEAAHEQAAKHEALGHHAFVYKTYATSSAELNERFLSYPEEAKYFIILHEFIHHFMSDLRSRIPYDFEEAIGDVVGNYGAIEFMQQLDDANLKSIHKQKLRNERLYKVINKTTEVINRKPGKANELNLKCQKRIERVLAHGDQFQKDRFGYPVNNAYLLKNRFYSENYFALRKLYKKTGTLKDFLDIIKIGPADPEKFGAYIDGLL